MVRRSEPRRRCDRRNHTTLATAVSRPVTATLRVLTVLLAMLLGADLVCGLSSAYATPMLDNRGGISPVKPKPKPPEELRLVRLPLFPAPKPAEIPPRPPAFEGFRSARFGATRWQTLRAIRKDFGLDRREIGRFVQPDQGHLVYLAQPGELIPDAGPTKIFYIHDKDSRRLIQINIIWNEGTATGIEVAARLLTKYFLQFDTTKGQIVTNKKLNDGRTLFFLFEDRQNRSVSLIGGNPSMEQNSETPTSLMLSYSFNTRSDS